MSQWSGAFFFSFTAHFYMLSMPIFCVCSSCIPHTFSMRPLFHLSLYLHPHTPCAPRQGRKLLPPFNATGNPCKRAKGKWASLGVGDTPQMPEMGAGPPQFPMRKVLQGGHGLAQALTLAHWAFGCLFFIFQHGSTS